jgi:biotin carboxyl carrier protein
MQSESVASVPFDPAYVRQLVGIMGDAGLGELELSAAGQSIRFRRSAGQQAVDTGRAGGPHVGPPPATVPVDTVEPPDRARTPAHAARTTTVKAPCPGIVHLGESGQPFVQVGQSVTPDTVVALIATADALNEIPAECAGALARTLVTDGAHVDYGTALMEITPETP